MSDTIILSDEEDEPKTPFHFRPKKPRPAPTIFLLDDDDPTPKKPPLPSPLVVPESPFSDIPNVKSLLVSPRGDGYICLEDESFSPSPFRFFGFKEDMKSTHVSVEDSPRLSMMRDDVYQVEDNHEEENLGMEHIDDFGNSNDRTALNLDKNVDENETTKKKKMTKEERYHLKEERKLKKVEEKMQKAALKAQEKQHKASLKAQAAELKKVEKEKKKWETGKFALKSILAEVDTKVVEKGSVGGHLLTKFSEQNLAYRITSNPIECSIVWRMNLPETISQLPAEVSEIRYVLLVYEAEEFCNLVAEELVLDHVSRVRSCYPSYTICYLTNRLMAYINRREREKYKSPEIDDGWRCLPIEEVLAKLTTHYQKVHHRQCRDEAELAEHVVGLTCSLASCQYRTKLTRLSVNANGSFLPKDCVDRTLIKKNPWLKALVAIPKVQPRFAIAIWKKYPTMKSLLSEYMDPNKSVHEKEFLLQDLTVEGLLGGERRVGQICSKRVYRILMAKSGSIGTDDVEYGADIFTNHPS